MVEKLAALLTVLLLATLVVAAEPPAPAEGPVVPEPAKPKPPPGLTVRTGEPEARVALLSPEALRPVAGAWRGLLDPARAMAPDAKKADEDGLVTLPRPEDGRPRLLLVVGQKTAPRLVGPRVFLPGETIEAPGRPIGRLAGRLLDAKGEPVEGAEILALEEPPGNLLVVEPPALLGFRGRTAKDGAFALDRLPPGPFLLVVRAGKAGTVLLENRWCTEKPFELRLPAPATLGGQVLVEPDGDPVKGAIVLLVPQGTEPFREAVEAVTDEKGRWRMEGLPQAAYLLDVRGQGLLALAPREIVPRAGAERLDLDFTLRRRGGLRGRVVTVATDPVPGARIYLRYPSTLETDIELPDPDRPVAVTDEKGAFEVGELPPEGNLRIGIRAPGLAPVVIEDISVAGGAVTELKPTMLEAGARVVGRVVAEESPETGLAGVRLIAVPVAEDPRSALETTPSWTARETVSGEDGAFALEGLAPGSYRLAAARPDRATVVTGALEVKLLDKGAQEPKQVLALPSGERIEGVVRNEKAEPVAGATVVVASHAGGPGRRETRSAADGSFVVTGLTPGLYDVSAEAPGLAPTRVTGVGPGHVILVLPAPGSVIGRVVTGEDGTPAFSLAALRRVEVEGNRPGDERFEPSFYGRFRSPGGEFRVDSLAPGTYRLEVELAGGRTGYVDGVVIPTGGTVEGVEIPTAASGTLLGRVLGDGRSVEGALVSLLTPDSTAARATTHTDEDGAYRLERVPMGPVEILVEARDFAPARVEGLRMLEGLVQRVDDIVLSAGAALRIRARGPTGEPMGGAAFTLESLEVGWRETARTDEEGELIVDLLTPGSYRVWRADERGDTSWIVRVDVGTVADLVVDLSAGTEVRGILRRGGKPAGRARLEAIRLDATGDARLDRRIQRGVADEEGRFTLAGLVPGAYILRIRTAAAADGTVLVPLDVPETRVHDVTLELPRGGLVVTVVDQEGGEPLGGVDVRVRRGSTPAGRGLVAGLGHEVGRGRTGPDGRLAVTGLDPGIYRVEAYHQGRGQVADVATVTPGEEAAVVSLRMGRAGLVTGKVLDLRQRPVPGAYVVVQGASGRPATLRERIPVGSDGSFRIEGLATGTYRIRAEGPGHARDTRWRVDVFTGGEAKLTFRLEEEGRLRVTVFGPGGVVLRGAEVEVLDAFGHHVWPPREDVDLYRVYGEEWLTDVRGQVLVTSLPAGVHVVRARLRGLKPFSTRVLISTGVENRAGVVLLAE